VGSCGVSGVSRVPGVSLSNSWRLIAANLLTDLHVAHSEQRSHRQPTVTLNKCRKFPLKWRPKTADGESPRASNPPKVARTHIPLAKTHTPCACAAGIVLKKSGLKRAASCDEGESFVFHVHVLTLRLFLWRPLDLHLELNALRPRRQKGCGSTL